MFTSVAFWIVVYIIMIGVTGRLLHIADKGLSWDEMESEDKTVSVAASIFWPFTLFIALLIVIGLGIAFIFKTFVFSNWRELGAARRAKRGLTKIDKELSKEQT